MRRWLPILSAGALTMAFAVWVSLKIDQDIFVTYARPADLIRRLGVSGAYVAVGCILWSRRTDSRIGPLLVLYAFLWILGANLAPAAGELLPFWAIILTSAVTALYGVPLVWLVVSFPTGRLLRPIDRAAVGLVTVDAVTQGAMRVIGDYSNTVGAFWGRYYSVANGLVALFVLCVVLVRLARAASLERRTLTPVWVASATLAVIFFISGVQALAIALTPRQAYALATTLDYTSMLIPIAYGAGLLRLRSMRGAIGKLVRELHEQPAPGKLRDALARALDDPSTELAFWLPERGGFVDLDGRTVELPAAGAGRAVTMLEHGDQRLGAIIYNPTLAEASDLVASVGAATALALENERLQAAVRAQLEEVRASRQRIVESADDERRRIERNLHDGAQQRLMTVSLALRRAQRRLNQDSSAADAILTEAAAELNLAVTELRELARGIHPTILTNEGLGPALESLKDRCHVPVDLHQSVESRLPAAAEATTYFVVSEALANVEKHAAARTVEVSVTSDGHSIIVEVVDDGIGGADAGKGSGLRGLSDRIAAVDGRLVVDSPPGGGTRLRAELPCG